MSVYNSPPRTRRTLQRPVSILTFVVLGVLATLFATDARGASVEPFDSLEVGVLAVFDVTGADEYHEYWQQGRGVEAFAQTPFYSGSMRLGVRYLVNDHQPGQTVPDSRSIYVYLGWSMFEIAVVRDRLIAELGLGVGVNQWRFAADPQQPGNENEMEAATELYGRARWVFAGSWSLNGSIRYQTIYTYNAIDTFFATAGLSRSFGMPGWLKGFLE